MGQVGHTPADKVYLASVSNVDLEQLNVELHDLIIGPRGLWAKMRFLAMPRSGTQQHRGVVLGEKLSPSL